MTLTSINRFLRKSLLLGGAMSFATTLFVASSFAQVKPAHIEEGYEPNYNEETHEERAKLVTDPAVSGDITDYTEVRRFGYEQWKKMDKRYALKPQGASAWIQVTQNGSQGGFISGRARSIAFHPSDPNTVWVATAQGGIWRTNNIYADAPDWVNLSENLPTLAMGAIAVDPKDPNILFAGTGETNGGYSTPGGQGLFRSKDGGLNWTKVAETDVAGTNCSEIIVDPQDSRFVYVATGSGKGFLKSSDGGDTWKKTSTAGSPVSIEINAQDPNKIYFSGQSGGVYRSTDRGETWIKCDLPGVNTSQRVMLAIAASSPNIIYAAVLTSASTTKLFRSEDDGQTWTLKNDATADPRSNRSSPNVNYLWNSSQGNYAHSLVVDPTNPNYVFAGGLFIVFSSNQGEKLLVRNDNYGDGSSSKFVHSDIQFLAFNSDNKLFSLSDGGIAYATDKAASNWVKNPNIKLGTLQFVGIDADKAFTYVIGGTQDNGTNKAALNDANWKEIHGGDGGFAAVAQDDPSVVYGTSIDGDFRPFIFKSNNSGQSWVINNQGSENIISNPELVNSLEFYPKYAISSTGSVIAVSGPGTVYVSADGGGDGFSIKGNSMGTRPQAIHISPTQDYLLWAGTNKKVWYSQDQGNAWTGVSVPTSGTITGIVSDANNPEAVFAVSGGASTLMGKNFARSFDGGKNWEMPATQLPSIPMWSIARSKRGHLFIGTDFGVIYSTDEGATWSQLGQGLPMAQVLSLKVRGNDDEWLLAGVFGRGAYYINIANVGGVGGSDAAKSISLGQSYPNPVDANATEMSIEFNLEHAGLAQLTLVDMMGREVMTLAKDNFTSGAHKVTVPTTNLEAGTYFYTLTSNGQTVSEKLVVTK